jgi:hypothetical protein
VDGRGWGITPVSIPDLTRGPHRVQLARDGYRPEDRRVVIARARPVTALRVTLTPARAPAVSAGVLNIESRPEGAQAFLDGTLRGVTPLAIRSVPAGDHALRLNHVGFRPWSSSIRIAASENTRVTASLEEE